MSVFDGLADIFADTLGEAVDYTPAGGATETITAIWDESGEGFAVGLESPQADGLTVRLHVRETNVAAPAEGDTAKRVKTGETLRIVPPILPDGKGMIVCALSA